MISALTNSYKLHGKNKSSKLTAKGHGLSSLTNSKLGNATKPNTSHNTKNRKSHKNGNNPLASRYFKSSKYVSPHMNRKHIKDTINSSNYSNQNNPKSMSNSRISLNSINNSGLNKSRKKPHMPLSNYLKNNFFLRNNYSKNTSKRTSKNGSKASSRLGLKSNSRHSKLGPRVSSKYSDLGLSKNHKTSKNTSRQINTSNSKKLNKSSKRQQSSRLLLDPLDKINERHTRTGENSKLGLNSYNKSTQFKDMVPSYNSVHVKKLKGLDYSLLNKTWEIV